MRDWQGKRYWIVGASEGLGRALAERLSRAGCELILSARSADRLHTLAADLPGRARVVTVDVTDDESVARATAEVGEIDGVVFLAGAYWPQSAADWDPQKVTAMCDVNFTGCARVMGHVVPGMVARDFGHVVMTGSLSGFRGLPGAVGYGASKAGVMYLAEGLYGELRKTGVDVQLVNPGFIRTRLTDKNDFSMPFIMDPDQAAQEVFEHMQGDGFKKSFPFAFAGMFRLTQFLPDWLYFRLFG
ncbi:SDR family oxidoreductase [Oceaniovalibus sp. ACAM 378]|uniref:SDR family NAD(P)-dependent oxidoreductase n=1 Tax=Oceaniovalibus sp. ACAM 378 TaxID=2599923 RepID=UPI0011D97182|nr:SDR family NAD(P)-dependent oxidoreductase [Oceaniovalibus sp. ACAM 378]TYB86336.1 SDR family NAD(P)-dependent oxidoreductase [Oceaniovalibus sp. ACAM 378]